MTHAKALHSVAAKVLNEEGQEEVDALIVDGKMSEAKAYVLGGIDRCFNDKLFDTSSAAILYAELGVEPEHASRIRQQSSN
jgi:hypothetical protein